MLGGSVSLFESGIARFLKHGFHAADAICHTFPDQPFIHATMQAILLRCWLPAAAMRRRWAIGDRVVSGNCRGKGRGDGDRCGAGGACSQRWFLGGRCGGNPPAQGRAAGPTAPVWHSPWRRPAERRPPALSRLSGPEPPEGVCACRRPLTRSEGRGVRNTFARLGKGRELTMAE